MKMARPQLRKAAKDYPQNGIAKGDSYYYVKIKTGPYSSRTIRSKTCPKRYELTGSAFYSQLWQIEDERFDGISTASDIRDIAEDIRSLGEECRDSFDNMPEGLQQGDTGQRLEERANNCESWADELDSVADELESAEEEFDAALEPWKAYNAKLAEYEAMDEEEQEAEGEPDEPNETLPDVLDGVDLDDENAVSEARNEMVAEFASQAADTNPGID
jgi:hypothetical protein